ncbi:hypothetical protein LOTGIDRAFT_166715 [Lottia gigantea]|uniref:Reverse transcriptase zinc-binding domain-containing protein n=1 Tax=Lottia gigantea TaxID=225164 RepID=V4BDX3_LOTGI|nr:hypothetical protein LOTGIDRAFT_166715 [Lottia gigantea]ESO86979.1 hypothetical protein LOTGIDRAFT_166715 [Lottia gigantea]
MSYGAGIWGMVEHKKLNSVQNRACKLFLGLKRNSPNLAARGDMGWTSCLTKQRVEVLRLFCRLKCLSNDRLPVMISNWSSRRSKSWEKSVEAMIRNLNVSHICNVDNISKSHMNPLKRHLFQIDESKWFQDLWNDDKNPNGNKLRTYRLFKKDLKPEPYALSHFLPRHLRKATALLRSGSSDLMIEKLRYSHPPTPLNCRTCPFCLEIETETHFLVECDMYSDIHFELFQEMHKTDNNFYNLSPKEKMIMILSSDLVNPKTISSYIYEMFSSRNYYMSYNYRT